jgi:hypothetical protein
MKISSILLLSPPAGSAAGGLADAGASVAAGAIVGSSTGLGMTGVNALVGFFTGFAGFGGAAGVVRLDGLELLGRGVVVRRAGLVARGLGVVVFAGGVVAGGASGVTGGASGAGAAAKAMPGIRAIARAHSNTSRERPPAPSRQRRFVMVEASEASDGSSPKFGSVHRLLSLGEGESIGAILAHRPRRDPPRMGGCATCTFVLDFGSCNAEVSARESSKRRIPSLKERAGRPELVGLAP